MLARHCRTRLELLTNLAVKRAKGRSQSIAQVVRRRGINAFTNRPIHVFDTGGGRWGIASFILEDGALNVSHRAG